MLATHVFAGTAAPDVIHVNYTPWTVTVTINGVNQSAQEGQIDEFVIDGMGGDDQINIEGSSTSPMHVRGGDGDDTIRVTPGSEHFGALRGPLFLHGDAGENLLVMSDQSHPTGTTYTLTATTLYRFGMAQLINFEQFGDVIFQAGQGADTIDVRGVASGVNVTVKAGGGGANVRDHIRVGSETSTLAEILGNLNVDGQEGNDHIELRDLGTDAHHQYKLYETMLKRVGNWPNIHFNNVKVVSLLAGAGSNAIDVEATKAGTTVLVRGGDGNDLIRVAPTFKTFNAIAGLLWVDGEAGADNLHMHDESGDNEHYQVEPFSVRRGPQQHVDYSNFESLVLRATAGNNWINVHQTNEGTPVYVDGFDGDDLINVMGTAPDAPATLVQSSGRDSVWVGGSPSGARAELILSQSHALMQLTIGATGVVRVARQAPSQGELLVKTGWLEMDADGVLDLGDNALAIDYVEGTSPMASIRALLNTGSNNGAWNGRGISSSAAAARPGYALGYAEASDVFGQFPAPFVGGTVDADTIVIRFTRYGDANLDGNVNLGDFNRLAANFGGGADRTWSQGNFNYDDYVDLGDFNLLAANFGRAV